MQTRRIQLKLYARSGTLPEPERVVPVFHDWIRSSKLNETLIDVARYGHVAQGPAVVLVGRESDYVIDLGEGRAGLMTTRKRDVVPPEQRIGDVLRRALHAADLLEREGLGVCFATNELLLVAPDRLALPNDAESFRAAAPEIRAEAGRLLGQVELRQEGGRAEPFTVRIVRAEDEPVAAVLARTSSAWG